jgi:hypothetical protein
MRILGPRVCSITFAVTTIPRVSSCGSRSPPTSSTSGENGGEPAAEVDAVEVAAPEAAAPEAAAPEAAAAEDAEPSRNGTPEKDWGYVPMSEWADELD